LEKLKKENENILKITENGYEKIEKKFKELQTNIESIKNEYKNNTN
jgi:hypothetical protein